MELEGRKELVDTGKSSRTWMYPLFSFVWPYVMCSRHFLAQKWLIFGPKLQFLKLRSADCESRSW